MKIPLLLFFVFGLTFTLYSQDKFIDRFTLRQSFQSKNDKAEPAVFTFTKPKQNDESWLLNAAVGYNLLKSSVTVLTVDPYFEYHKNTLIDKKQDNWQAGVSTEWQMRDLSEQIWSPIWISAVKYNEDRIKQTTSFQGNIYFTPLFKGKGLKPKYFWIPNNASNFGELFQFIYSPYLGFENENRIRTQNESSSGSIYRALFRLTSAITLFPKSEKLCEKFEFTIDWQYRNNFEETVDSLTDSEHTFLTMSFNYAFFSAEDGKKVAKIGIDYTNGENPTKNFEQQSFYAVNIKVKL